MVTEPSSIFIARLKARHELETGKDTNIKIKRYLAIKRRADKELLEVYNFDEEHHNAVFNTATIMSRGSCGCGLCKALYDYASAKVFLHRFKKSYYDPWGVTTHFKLFEDAYDKYLVNNKDKLILSEEEFFAGRVNELKEGYQKLRVLYISRRDAIYSLLEAPSKSVSVATSLR
jgi:hypothetical protein